MVYGRLNPPQPPWICRRTYLFFIIVYLLFSTPLFLGVREVEFIVFFSNRYIYTRMLNVNDNKIKTDKKKWAFPLSAVSDSIKNESNFNSHEL